MAGINPQLLRNVPLFSLLDESEADALAAQLDEVQYLAGQHVFAAGDEGGVMYVVHSGKVEIFMKDKNKEEICLGFREPGELFGELSLLDNETRSAGARAVSNTSLFRIDREDLMLLVQSHPAAALDMMAMLGKRIREADFMLHDRVVTRNANEEIPQSSGFGARLSDFLTAVAGDIRFVYFSVVWFVLWIGINTGLIPIIPPFDTYPFGFLTLVVSLEAIFLSLFILVSQNRQAAREKVRNDIEYEVNIRAELEIRQLSEQVENLQQLMLGHLSSMNTRLDSGVITQAEIERLKRPSE
jgi:CRP/FNR family transcriptional regulator, cyclic AMP receptor protein